MTWELFKSKVKEWQALCAVIKARIKVETGSQECKGSADGEEVRLKNDI